MRQLTALAGMLSSVCDGSSFIFLFLYFIKKKNKNIRGSNQLNDEVCLVCGGLGSNLTLTFTVRCLFCLFV